jgi:hypothetical protein
VNRRTAINISAINISLTMFLSGCGGQTTPMHRLETSFPVDASKFKVSQCQLDGDALSDSSPLSAKRGESLEMTGIISSGDWKAGGLDGDWKYELDEERPPGRMRPSNDREVYLFAFIHGSDTTKELGIVASAKVENRLKDKNSLDHEFRAKIKAPSGNGKYVLDLQAIEMSTAQLKRGEKQTKPASFPIWRRELWVE